MINHGTLELALALGLTDKIVAASPPRHGPIWSLVADEYKKLEQSGRIYSPREGNLGSGYPSTKALLDTKPDFLFGAFMSVFEDNVYNETDPEKKKISGYFNYSKELGIGAHCKLNLTIRNKQRYFCREELIDHGIDTFTETCEDSNLRPDEVTTSHYLDEIQTIGNIFNVSDNAREIINTMDTQFKKAKEISNQHSHPIRTLWVDSWDPDGHSPHPLVGACCGAPGIVMDHAGVQNVFDDYGRDRSLPWGAQNVTSIATTDPDVIVIVHASWSNDGKCFEQNNILRY